MNGDETTPAVVAGRTQEGTTPRRSAVTVATWLGLAVVLIAAAVLSFDALRGLALAVRIPGHFAWLLPIAVDAGAAVSCAVWLSGRVPADASRFARGMTWALLGSTVVANAGQLAMHAHNIAPPWWVAVAVGAVPPAVVGSVVHLAVLVGRAAHPVTPAAVSVPSTADTAPAQTVSEPTGDDAATSETGDDDDQLAVVRRLVANGAGRGTVAAELDITPAQARGLIEKVRAA